eukprot:754827-Hanusia_phi.AAC.3
MLPSAVMEQHRTGVCCCGSSKGRDVKQHMGDLIDRREEVKVFLEMSRRNLGPACLGLIYADGDQDNSVGRGGNDDNLPALPIGRIEEFLDGWRTLEPKDFRDSLTVRSVVGNMKKWHKTEVESMARKPRILDDIRRMLRKIASSGRELFVRLASLGYQGRDDVIERGNAFVEVDSIGSV